MKKIDFIVYLRCLAVFLVVVGHGINIYSGSWEGHAPTIDNMLWSQLKRLIYMIHLPIFTIISGYIYIYIRKAGGYDSFKSFLTKKVKRILIPLLIWSFIECTIDFNCNYSLILTAPLHLWYLQFLFICFLITYFYDKYLIKFPWIIILLVGLIEMKKYILPDVFPTFFGYYSWFLIGMGLHEITSHVDLKRSIVLLFLGGAIALCAISFITVGRAGISAIFLVVSLFLLFWVTKFSPVPNWINSIDKSSMGIYLIHHPIIWNFVSTTWGWQYMKEYPYVTPLLLIIVTFAISWLAAHYILKTKYLRYIIGG